MRNLVVGVAIAALLAAGAAVAVEQKATPVPKMQLQQPPPWRYGALKPQMELRSGPVKIVTERTVKKEVKCLLMYPPMYTTGLMWVNNTGTSMPIGTVIQWKVQGEWGPPGNPANPPQVFTGYTLPISFVWQPNPPAEQFVYQWNLLYPMQKWNCECQAWAILP